jgi:acetoin utilization protein AcuC
LTISFHENGRFLFPGTGEVTETGQGEGEGYSVNVPLLPGTDDEVFMFAFDEVAPAFIESFKPDILVAQLGVDALKTDPLSHLELTTNGFIHAVRTIVKMCPKLVALGGGGYNVDNVARAWTLAWGVMCGKEPPDELPSEYISQLGTDAGAGRRLRDAPLIQTSSNKPAAMREAEKTVAYLLEKVLPRVKAPA